MISKYTFIYVEGLCGRERSGSPQPKSGSAARDLSCKRKRPPRFLLMAVIYVGDDLLSHTLSRAVQSAQQGLTSVFGMGTGVSPAVRSPASQARAGYSPRLGPRRHSTQDLSAKLERTFSTAPGNRRSFVGRLRRPELKLWPTAPSSG